MPQTTVTTLYPLAFVGMEPDSSNLAGDMYISRVSGETTLQIPFGVCVKQGTNDDQCVNLSGQASTNLLGVVPYSASYQIAHELSQTVDSNGNLGLLPTVTVQIKRRGRLWVQIDENVASTNAVKVRTANASAGIGPGTFRKTAVGSDTLDLSAFAKWVGTNLAANGYGLLEFDFTMSAGATSD